MRLRAIPQLIPENTPCKINIPYLLSFVPVAPFSSRIRAAELPSRTSYPKLLLFPLQSSVHVPAFYVELGICKLLKVEAALLPMSFRRSSSFHGLAVNTPSSVHPSMQVINSH